MPLDRVLLIVSVAVSTVLAIGRMRRRIREERAGAAPPPAPEPVIADEGGGRHGHRPGEE